MSQMEAQFDLETRTRQAGCLPLPTTSQAFDPY
jgi:hypothetical protein